MTLSTKFPKFILLISLIVITLVSVGCFDRESLFRPSRITGPTPPESTLVSTCDTILTKTVTEASEQLSVAHPRKVFADHVDINCDQHLIKNLVVITNDAGTDAAFVKYFETMPGRPYHRYYFTNVFGDTLHRPTTSNGSETTFNLRAESVPTGQYLDVAVYKGTISTPSSRVRPASTWNTQWNIAMRGTLEIYCITCVDSLVTIKNP